MYGHPRTYNQSSIGVVIMIPKPSDAAKGTGLGLYGALQYESMSKGCGHGSEKDSEKTAFCT